MRTVCVFAGYRGRPREGIPNVQLRFNTQYSSGFRNARQNWWVCRIEHTPKDQPKAPCLKGETFERLDVVVAFGGYG